jgi:hypothetical protein
MTKQDLVEAVAKATGLSKRGAAGAVEATIEGISRGSGRTSGRAVRFRHVHGSQAKRTGATRAPAKRLRSARARPSVSRPHRP